jgi:LDH2 family malate/lactate/ureidoglycolate dehydrogenase
VQHPSIAAVSAWAAALLQAAGAQLDKALVTAQVLVEGDLLGHDTHGLAQLPGYLNALCDGTMLGAGEPEVLAQRPAVATWDGKRLPGPWLTRQAIDWCRPRAREFGVATVAIKRSHHIGCLAAYLEAPARDGYLVEVICSDPSGASVAPFGGTKAVFTPNPIAIGFPTGSDPVMTDISASITTNAMSARLKNAGTPGAHAWWLTPGGQPTNDASTIFAVPPGTILPTGGADHGQKGYGLALMVEALTAGLTGFGRADPSQGWGATVLVRLTDTRAFAGTEAFVHQMDWLVKACRTNPPANSNQPVRLPGERGLARKQHQLAHGLQLHASILPALTPWAQRFNLPIPQESLT